MLSAGEFNQRVTLANPSFTKDAAGSAVRAEGSGTTVWAKVSHVGAGERFQEGEQQTRPELRVIIRYRTGIKLRDTLTWRGVAYEINAEPKEQEDRQQRRLIELLCVKRKPGQGST